jgi:hypothetical protein
MGLLFISQVIYDCGDRSEMILTRENQRTQRKTCPSATLSATSTAWTDPGLRGERPATNHVSRGMVEDRVKEFSKQKHDINIKNGISLMLST